MKILAVDDNSITLGLLKMLAARAGFTDILTATSGEVALSMINKGDIVFDCLLLDISMPAMNGIELCGLVRAIPTYNKTPIIMLTAMTDKDNIDSAFIAGATDYATKPFDVVELDARLRSAETVVRNTKMELKKDFKETEQSQSDQTQKQDSDLTGEIQIEGIDGLIGYDVFRNYIAQLSRAGLAGSQVIAVKIDQIDTIHAKASTDEFLYALTEVADAISDTIKTNGYMMAYAGNGIFLVVSNKASMESSVKMEAEIQHLLDERGTEYDNSDPLDIEIAIGNPIRPSFNKSQQIRKTFARAIARAENRSLRRKNEPKLPYIRLIKK
ncbi:MAG: CheY-like chemotaxis protein [Octadecabacter sp.]|jgi:CheY-like chemotaxis protein